MRPLALNNSTGSTHYALGASHNFSLTRLKQEGLGEENFDTRLKYSNFKIKELKLLGRGQSCSPDTERERQRTSLLESSAAEGYGDKRFSATPAPYNISYTFAFLF